MSAMMDVVDRPGRGGMLRAVRLATAVVVGCLLASLALGGCTSARSNLGTSVSSCFSSLPAATRAVGGHGHLVSVHLVTLKSLEHVAPGVYRSLHTGQEPKTRVCAVLFSGRFASHSVERPRGNPAGPLAVTVLDTPSNDVVGTVIFRHTLQQLGPRHILTF